MEELNEIEIIEKFEWTNRYVKYLSLRQKGLKKDAKVELKEFMADFEKQDVSSKRSFIDLVFKTAYKTNNYNRYLPFNLANLLRDEIGIWINAEPGNPVPYRWSGDLELIRKSIDIDPNDQIALEIYLNRIVGRISMNQHEIDAGLPYDGNPSEDLKVLKSAEALLANLDMESLKEAIQQEIMQLREVADSYILRHN